MPSVCSRGLYAVKTPLPKAKAELHALNQALVPEMRAGDFVQALMDLGATICTPKRPACAICPWIDHCRAREQGIQESLPVKAQKAARPLRRGAAFVARDVKGAVLLVKRPQDGLLGAMLQPPLGPWGAEFPSARQAMREAPFAASWKKRGGVVRHGFTHFELEMEVYFASVEKRPVKGKMGAGSRRCRAADGDEEDYRSRARNSDQTSAQTLTQHIDRRQRAVGQFEVPEGPAVARIEPLHMGTDAMDRAARIGTDEAAVGAHLGPVTLLRALQHRARRQQSALDHPAKGNARFGALGAGDFDRVIGAQV